MIIVNLKGGLGNQMFQYATGRTLALLNKASLKLEVGGLTRANNHGDIYRDFGLGVFNIQKDLASPEEVKRLKYPYGIFSKAWRWCSFRLLRRTNVVFDQKVLEQTGDIFLDGYFQSPLYFNNTREVLLQDFTLEKPLSPAGLQVLEQITATTSASVHVRRGDYIKNPRVHQEFGVCSPDYYKKALVHVTAVVPQATYFIFSDDIEWVRNNLPIGENAVFVEDPTISTTEELALMSKCAHNIIANSSFSWWGAWLNQNPDKIVIAPSPWFDKQIFDSSLIPPSWTQIPK